MTDKSKNANDFSIEIEGEPNQNCMSRSSSLSSIHDFQLNELSLKIGEQMIDLMIDIERYRITELEEPKDGRKTYQNIFNKFYERTLSKQSLHK